MLLGADCTEAIRLDPNLAEAYNSRNVVFEEIDEKAKAAAANANAKLRGYTP